MRVWPWRTWWDPREQRRQIHTVGFRAFTLGGPIMGRAREECSGFPAGKRSGFGSPEAAGETRLSGTRCFGVEFLPSPGCRVAVRWTPARCGRCLKPSRGAGKNRVTSRHLRCPADAWDLSVGGAVRFVVNGRALALACVVEVSVDGGAGHAEEVGDLLDGVVAGVVELLCEGDLLGVEPGPAAASASASGQIGRAHV